VKHPLTWLLVLALLAHGSGLANGFVYDDHRFVVNNAALRDADISALVLDPATQTTDGDRDVYRPLRTLGHAWDMRHWGPRPFGFHLHSLLVHLANVALGYVLLSRWLPSPSQAAALLGATVLAVHPLGVEVVGWISSRGDLYALAFALSALLCADRAGPARTSTGRRAAFMAWLAAAAACAALATMGKESAAWIVPVGWLAWRWLGRLSGASVLALCLGVGAALLLRQIALDNLSPSQTTPHGGNAFTQVGWALYGTGRTLFALVWPTGLSAEYPQARWALGPPVWIAWPTWLAAAAIAGVVLLRRGRQPAAAFLLAWLLLAWLPSSSLLVTLRSLVNDRGSYPCLLAAGALAGVMLSRHTPRAALLGSAALALILVPLSMQRTAVFHDDASLWSGVLQVDPLSVRAHLGLAVASDDPEVQRSEFSRALAVAIPGTRLAGVASARYGDFLLRQGDDASVALPLLQQSLAVQRQQRDRAAPGPDEAATAASLAECLLLAGQPEASDQVMQEAILEQPTLIMLHVKRTALLLFRAERDKDPAAAHQAMLALAGAVALDPGHPMVGALRQRLRDLLAEGP